MSLTSVFGMGSDGSAAGGGVKRPERVPAVGEGRRCFVTEDIRRAPQQETGGRPPVLIQKENLTTGVVRFCVGITYLPGQSPAKYCQRT